MNLHAAKDLAFDVVVSCSVLHTVLPPYDFLSDFPRLQKIYKATIYLIGYVSISARSAVWKQISTDSGTRVSDVAKGTP